MLSRHSGFVTRRSLALIGVCVLLTAGCSGFLGGETPTSPTTTTTPAPIPSDTVTPDRSVRQVPGLTEQGVENPFALGRAHHAVLSNVSYTQRTTEISRFSNGSLRRNVTRNHRVAPSDATAHSIQHTISTYKGLLSQGTHSIRPPSVSRATRLTTSTFTSRFRTAPRQSVHSTGAAMGGPQPSNSCFPRSVLGYRDGRHVERTHVTASGPRSLQASSLSNAPADFLKSGL